MVAYITLDHMGPGRRRPVDRGIAEVGLIVPRRPAWATRSLPANQADRRPPPNAFHFFSISAPNWNLKPCMRAFRLGIGGSGSLGIGSYQNVATLQSSRRSK